MKELANLVQVLVPLILGLLTYKLNFDKSNHDELKDVIAQLNKENETFLKRIEVLNKQVEVLKKENERLRNDKH